MQFIYIERAWVIYNNYDDAADWQIELCLLYDEICMNLQKFATCVFCLNGLQGWWEQVADGNREIFSLNGLKIKQRASERECK